MCRFAYSKICNQKWDSELLGFATIYLRMGVSGIIGDASDQVPGAVLKYKQKDDDGDYLTLCPAPPKLTEDESGYVQCE